MFVASDDYDDDDVVVSSSLYHSFTIVYVLA